jgi:hypothetical protein
MHGLPSAILDIASIRFSSFLTPAPARLDLADLAAEV